LTYFAEVEKDSALGRFVVRIVAPVLTSLLA
jgi:hypothetical protein